MKKEIWIHSKEKISSNMRKIVVGDETCIYRAIHKDVRESIEYALMHDMNIRYITPPIPDRYIPEIMEIISSSCKLGVIRVTFNDLGLLYACKNLISEKLIIPVLGRIITHSLIDCLWSDRLFESEEDSIMQGLLNYSFYHGSKIDFFKKKYEIKEYEFNFHEDMNLEYFKEQGIDIVCHEGYNLVSVGRHCYQSKAIVKQFRCYDGVLCDNKKIRIEMTNIWNRNRMLYQKPEEEISRKLSELFISGNAVYQKIGQISDGQISSIIINL